VATDDAGLFEPVAKAGLTEEDKCGVCQEAFLEEDEEEKGEADLVRLVTCACRWVDV
jgi:hypothetical protein